MTAPVDPSSPPAPFPHAEAYIQPHLGGLREFYSPPDNFFDELQEPSGAIRPHWQMFLNLLNDLGPVELQRRWQ